MSANTADEGVTEVFREEPEFELGRIHKIFFFLTKRMGINTLLVRDWSPGNKDRRKQREFDTQGERHVVCSGKGEACVKVIEAGEAGKAAEPYGVA